METDAKQVTFEDSMSRVIDDMKESDTEQLKFLCMDHIPVGKIEHMEINDLLLTLQEKRIVTANKYDFLIECLILIGRLDIVHELGCNEHDRKELAANLKEYKSSCDLKSFTILLHTLAANMEVSDVDKSITCLGSCNIPKGKLSKCRNGFQLMSLLQKSEHISEGNHLQRLFEIIRRPNLQNKIKLYKEKTSKNLNLSSPSGPTVQSEISEKPEAEKKLEKYEMTAKPRDYKMETYDKSEIYANIISQMQKSDAEKVKFLCSECPKFGEDMDITDFITGHLKKQKIGNADKYDFLIECLILIGQLDIAYKLNCNKHDMNELASNLKQYKSFAGLNSFIILLHTLADNMEESEVERIRLYLGAQAYIPKRKLEKCYNALQLMSLLLKVRHIQPNNLQSLFHLVQLLRRMDLHAQIKSYEAIDSRSTESYRKPTGCCWEVNKSKNGEDGDYDNESIVGEQTLQKYKMDAKPRGICLIFNNVNFQTEKLKERTGSDVDKDELEKVFKSFHFEITVFDDLTKTEMKEKLEEFASKDHTRYDCFVCCILSHGAEGMVYGVDGEGLSYITVTSGFTSSKCKSLAGKPKLFFIQACQGSSLQKAIQIESDGDSTATIPDGADFLMAYATIQGYRAIRSKTTGTWFIQKLCKVFNDLGKKYDLSDMLLEVNNSVSKKEGLLNGEMFKQVPAPLSTLRKKLFFLDAL